jgi:hypothetical protein
LLAVEPFEELHAMPAERRSNRTAHAAWTERRHRFRERGAEETRDRVALGRELTRIREGLSGGVRARAVREMRGVGNGRFLAREDVDEVPAHGPSPSCARRVEYARSAAHVLDEQEELLHEPLTNDGILLVEAEPERLAIEDLVFDGTRIDLTAPF